MRLTIGRKSFAVLRLCAEYLKGSWLDLNTRKRRKTAKTQKAGPGDNKIVTAVLVSSGIRVYDRRTQKGDSL
jgi:hypothetical protein